MSASLLSQVDFIASPNFDERPTDSEINLLVIHAISLPPSEFGGDYIEQFFCNQLDHSAHPYFETIKELKVSAHVLINRNGKVVQFVPFEKRAWHAGESSFDGQGHCNDYSIGIELEGTDDQAFTDLQYAKLLELTKLLCTRYPKITAERIVGHSDIAPGRKTDPGVGFDWERLREGLAS